MSTAMSTKALEERIADKIDRALTEGMSVSASDGGTQFGKMIEVMEFAKIMAIGGVALPQFLRGNVGACLAICIQAIEWRMSPFAVANKAYVVNDRVAYESQLIHAVIEQRAPLVGRLRHTFSGDGASRRCTVIGRVIGEDVPFEYTSPEFKDINPKNSPLWKTKPDLQLYYNSSRDWARMYFPDVILGVYSDDEIAAAHSEAAAKPKTLGELAASRTVVTVEQPQPPIDDNHPQLLPEGTPILTASDRLVNYRIAINHASTAAECDALIEAEVPHDETNPHGLTKEQQREVVKLFNDRVALVSAK